MFKGSENKINKKLTCSVCNHEQQVPEHHGNTMRWVLEGSFRKKELFKCEGCGCFMEIPLHCGLNMLYSEEEEDDDDAND